jgi:hypothetical protein
MAKFQVGNNGKRLGSKHLAYYKIGYWLDKLHEELPNLTANQRANISVELIKLLVNKSKALPIDPNDSKLNATEALKLLQDVELTKAEVETAAKANAIAIPKLDGKD